MRIHEALLGLVSLVTALPVEFSAYSSYSSPDGANASGPPRNIVYVQTFRTVQGGKLSLLPMIEQQTQATHIILSAVHINSEPGDINLNDHSPNDTMYDSIWQEAAHLQEDGVKVLMMLGGAAPGSYPRLCSGSSGSNRSNGTIVNEDFYMPLYYMLKFHEVDGLDLDIEERVAYTCPLALLQRLHKDFGPNFILTMAPVATDLQPAEFGLGGFSYKTLDAAATATDKPNGKLVDWFSAQFYNSWGDASSPNGYNAIIKNGWAAGRVVLGVLASPDDGGSGWYSIGKYRQTVQTLRTNYEDFGGIMGWEYWDAGRHDNLSDPWMWVAETGKSVLELTQQGRVDLASDPIPLGGTAWPSLMETLTGLGVAPLAAVRALNISNGDLSQALQMLDLPALDLSQVADELDLPLKQ